MNKKIIIFGASSFIAQEISNKLRDNYELICISKKKIFNKKIKFIKTNYNLNNIKKILKKNINKKDKPVFIFFNSLSDNKIFIKKSIKEIENIIYKSDTQGFDEELFFSLDKKILNKIDILILEISNFKYLIKNKNKLINIIKDYNIIEDERGQKINFDMILKKINKQEEFNLLISRY